MSDISDLTELPTGLKEEWSLFLQSVIGEESYWTHIIFVVVLFIIFVIGVLGNLLTCVVIYCEKSMHTVTNFYLFDLAISDLFMSFAILLEITNHLSESYQEYPFGGLFCKIHFFLIVVLWNNSILVMMALSIERYIAIWHPLLLNSAPVWRRVIKVISLLLVLAIFEALPELWVTELVKTKYPKPSSICFTIPSDFARICNGIQAILTFVIPLLVMTFVYSMIVFKVNTTEKFNSRHKVFNHRDNRKKLNKLVALTVSFLVCWLPFFTLRVLICAVHMHALMNFKRWWYVAFNFVTINSWFSIVLNPLLFSLMSTKFRKALKSLWTSRFNRRRRLPQSSFVCATVTV